MRKINILQLIMKYKVKILGREISELIDRKNANKFLIKKKETQIIDLNCNTGMLNTMISRIEQKINKFKNIIEVM